MHCANLCIRIHTCSTEVNIPKRIHPSNIKTCVHTYMHTYIHPVRQYVHTYINYIHTYTSSTWWPSCTWGLYPRDPPGTAPDLPAWTEPSAADPTPHPRSHAHPQSALLMLVNKYTTYVNVYLNENVYINIYSLRCIQYNCMNVCILYSACRL